MSRSSPASRPNNSTASFASCCSTTQRSTWTANLPTSHSSGSRIHGRGCFRRPKGISSNSSLERLHYPQQRQMSRWSRNKPFQWSTATKCRAATKLHSCPCWNSKASCRKEHRAASNRTCKTSGWTWCPNSSKRRLSRPCKNTCKFTAHWTVNYKKRRKGRAN